MIDFVVWLLLPVHIVVSWYAQNKARQDAYSLWSKVHAALALLLWLGLVVVLHVHKLIRGASTGVDTLVSGHTQGIEYADIKREKGYAPQKYECPAAAQARRLLRLEQQGVQLLQDELYLSRTRGRRRGSVTATKDAAGTPIHAIAEVAKEVAGEVAEAVEEAVEETVEDIRDSALKAGVVIMDAAS